MKTNIYKSLVILMLGLFSGTIWASNIQITGGPEILSRNIAGNSIIVEFDLSWDNSWRLNRPNNWDAAWVFMKYRIDAGNFRHANLRAATVNGAGSTPVTIELGASTTPDGRTVNVGAFFFRSENNTWGTTELNGTRLNWDITGTGIQANTVLSVRVFAVEMVFVPEGAFHIGDEWSYDYLNVIGDMMFSSTWTPLVGESTTDNNRTGNIIPMITAAGNQDGWEATASTNPTTAFNAFNRNITGGWSPVATAQWDWIQIEMPAAQTATWCIINRSNGAQSANEIRGFFVSGSNDGSTWTVIHGDPEYVYPTVTNYKFGRSNFNSVPFAFDRPGSYRFYRFNFFAATTLIGGIQMFTGDASRINTISAADQLTNFFVGANNTLPVAGETSLAPVNPNFPNGFRGFYVMKHEVTQAAWVDFLNTLTWDQQYRLIAQASNNAYFPVPNQAWNAVTPASVVGTNLFHYQYPSNDERWGTVTREGVHRMNIRIRESGTDGPAVFGIGQEVTTVIEEDDGEGGVTTTSINGWHWDHEIYGGNVPMFNLAWTDVTAYLDWAGLRPMTELEYEKAARGTLAQGQRRRREEYAWGQPFLPSRAASTQDRNLPDETPLPLVANYAQAGDGGIGVNTAAAHSAAIKNFWPVRAGSFARGETTRDEAGATYWGILNLTDNAPERVINISTTAGRAFTGEHGDGELTATGLSNVRNWPSQDVALGQANGLAAGTGYRGIAAHTTTITTVTPVSWRQHIDHVVTAAGLTQNHRDFWTGARGGRTAP